MGPSEDASMIVESEDAYLVGHHGMNSPEVFLVILDYFGDP
jgi:hypothetical protein